MRSDVLTLWTACCSMFALDIALVVSSPDFYTLLGVNRSATQTQIKKAFRKLALLYHPDKHKDRKKEAEEKFLEIGKAYETLSNPEKRKLYDRYGEDYEKRNNGFQGSGFSFNFDDFFQGFDNSFGGQDSDDDTFSFFRSDGNRKKQGGFFEGLFDSEEDDSQGNGHDSFFQFESAFGGFDNFFNDHEDSHPSRKYSRQSNQRYHEDHDDMIFQQQQRRNGGRRCKTVTRRIGNVVTTHTECS